MKKEADNILIILNIVCIAATITGVMLGLLNQSGNTNEDTRSSSYATLLFACVHILIMFVIVFLAKA